MPQLSFFFSFDLLKDINVFDMEGNKIETYDDGLSICQKN